MSLSQGETNEGIFKRKYPKVASQQLRGEQRCPCMGYRAWPDHAGKPVAPLPTLESGAIRILHTSMASRLGSPIISLGGLVFLRVFGAPVGLFAASDGLFGAMEGVCGAPEGLCNSRI